jgi:peptidoglycan/LPS O-acetylase OafA/YrhL
MLPVNTSPTSLGYQPGLDGLRGVFVAAVLCFHGGFSWAVGGYLGVSAFFTLSGFLICSLLIDERARTGSVDLAHFWVRRARRLLPAAWLSLAMALAYGVTLASPSAQRSLQGDILAALGYVANWRFILTESSYESLFAEPSPVAHLWSLAIEEQYYLVFPLLVVGVLALAGGRRRYLAAVLVVLAVASTVWMAVLHDPGTDTARVYYGTDTRVAEMLLGAVAALVWRRVAQAPDMAHVMRRVDPALQVVAVGALIALVISWSQVPVSAGGLYRGGLFVHAIGVVIVVLAATRPGPVRSFASFEPLRRLGLVSYGVYLYHWPIFLWLNTARTGLDGWVLFAVRCGVTLAVAIASYLVVERPIRTGARLHGRVSLVVAPAAALVLVAGAMAAPSPAPTLMQSASFGAEIDPFDGFDLTELPDRAATEERGVPRISVFGDSTAIGPFYGLLDVDSTTGEVVVVPGRMVLGCGLVRAPAMRTLGELYPLTTTCSTWPDLWPAILTKSDPDIAVVLYGPWDASDHQLEGSDEWVAVGHPAYDELARSEIRRALDVLTAEVELVVWLSSPPIDQNRGQLNPPNDPASQPERIERWNELVRTEIEGYPGDRAVMVDLNAWFHALPNGPFDETLRPDGVHVTESQAPIVGRWLADEILALWTARPIEQDAPAAAPSA